ncbi:MAG: 2-C-methyl-D-erythritol 2,4-cyclodiphosphate synthase [Actinomycetota bacterium]
MNSNLRIGVGVDAHQFGKKGPCALAGLSWPDVPRLIAHSDGDAAVHALCDAVLSAAQLGDIGTLFGVDKPEMAGVSGIEMIRQLREYVISKGIAINNVSIQIVGNQPKIASRREEAQNVLSQALGAPVSITATTTDQMGFTGRGEGIYVVANALVEIL